MARNTELEYMYRDASNYKRHGGVVFAGEITDAERATITAALDRGEYLIADQVGLDDLRDQWETHYEDDHIWHEVIALELTDAVPAAGEDIHVFAARFVGIVWDVAAAAAELNTWLEQTPQGR